MQSRSLTGADFEKEICEKFGYIPNAKKPKIHWNGQGTNLMKIKSLNYDATKFKPTSSSTFEKWDVETKEGKKIEVKKYKIDQVKDWTLYSEPIVKVCTNSDVEFIQKEYGDGDLDMGRNKYNLFINQLFENMQSDGTLERIKDSIISNSEGIQFEDGFIDKSKIEFKWELSNGFWRGFDRVMLKFRVKN